LLQYLAAPIENPVAHAPAPPPAAADSHIDKSSAAAEGTTISLHPTILDGSSIAPSSEAEAADKDEPAAAQQKLEGEAASPGAPDAEVDAPVDDQEGAKLKKKKSKGRNSAGKGADENINTDPAGQAVVSAGRDIDTSATQDRAIEPLVTQERNETEKAETEAIAHDEQDPADQLVDEPESYIADAPTELPPIPEDEPLTNLPPAPLAPIDATGEDTTLSRSGSKKKKSKSRRPSLAEELEAAGEEAAEAAISSVNNTRPNSPTPSEDSFIVGDDAGSGGEPKIQRSGSKKKKKKSGSQRRKERALKRASLNNLQQASQDAEQAAEKKPESIELPPQVPSEGFNSLEQSGNTAEGGVKLDVGTPFFEDTEKKSARS